MSLPNTNHPLDTGYDFHEDQVVLPNQGTKEVFFDNLAENTDYLKKANMWGFNGNNDIGATRTSKPTTASSSIGTIGLGTGFFHIIKEVPEHSSEPTTLIDASQGLPDDIWGLRYKIITLNLRVVVTQVNSDSNPWSFIPGGLQDSVLASNKSMKGETASGDFDGDEQHTFNPEMLYSGEGIDPNIPPSWGNGYIQEWSHQFDLLKPIYPYTGTVDFFIWVSGSNSGSGKPGDLMCVANEIQNQHYYDKYLIILSGFYAPMWETV